jgi:hypothetical protein
VIVKHKHGSSKQCIFLVAEEDKIPTDHQQTWIVIRALSPCLRGQDGRKLPWVPILSLLLTKGGKGRGTMTKIAARVLGEDC